MAYRTLHPGTSIRVGWLGGWADGDVADFDVVWLFDGECDGAGDGLGRKRECVHALADLFADSGSSMELASSVRT